LNGTHL